MEMLQQIGVAMAVLGGLGAFFGLVLAMANRVFYVQTDPRLDRLIQALPGANRSSANLVAWALATAPRHVSLTPFTWNKAWPRWTRTSAPAA